MISVSGGMHTQGEPPALGRVLSLAHRNKLLLGLCLAAGVGGSLFAFVNTTKRYVATAVVALDVRKVTVAPQDLVISRLPQENPALRTELDILGSRSAAEIVIERVGAAEFEHMLDVPASVQFNNENAYRQALVDFLMGGLQVTNDGRSFTIYISYSASSPIFAAKIANAYAQQYLDHQTTVKFEAIKTASEWLGKKVDELRRKLEATERAVDDIHVKNLNELQRELAVNRALYESFLQRYKATIEQQDLAGPEAELISEAQPPSRPNSPKLLPLLAVGIFLGVAGGFGLALVRSHFDDRVWGSATLEAQTGIPVLGVIPAQSSADMRGLPSSSKRLVAWPKMVPRWHMRNPTEAEAAAALRRLQAVLRFSPATRGAKVIAVTSAVQGEGKTFVSIGLARAFLASGSTTLVIGADPHSPALAERLGLKCSFDWHELISSHLPIDDIIQQDPSSGVSAIIAGPTRTPQAALFAAAAFASLITELRERYDRIIIDTPPVLLSSDSTLLGAVADATVLVVRWRATTHTVVVEALRQLGLCSVPVVGTVLNQSKTHSSGRSSSSPPDDPSSIQQVRQVLGFKVAKIGRDRTNRGENRLS